MSSSSFRIYSLFRRLKYPLMIASFAPGAWESSISFFSCSVSTTVCFFDVAGFVVVVVSVVVFGSAVVFGSVAAAFGSTGCAVALGSAGCVVAGSAAGCDAAGSVGCAATAGSTASVADTFSTSEVTSPVPSISAVPSKNAAL